MKTLQDIKEELLKRPAFRKEYYKEDRDFEMAQRIMEVRIAHGLTQKELANLVSTKQPSIARLESGAHKPSLKLLQAIADALNIHLELPRFSTLWSIEVKNRHIGNVQDVGFRSSISTQTKSLD